LELRMIEMLIDSEREVAAIRARQAPPAWQVSQKATRSRWHFIPFMGATDR
jgi:hypothetical protein